MDQQSTPNPLDQIGRRASARLRVRLPARIITLDGAQSCILTDISATGLKLITKAAVKPGSELVILWGRFEAFGDVMWATSTHCGVALVDPLPKSIILSTRDLDERERLPDDEELVRRSAHGFVRGYGHS